MTFDPTYYIIPLLPTTVSSIDLESFRFAMQVHCGNRYEVPVNLTELQGE
jgi:hypothetical protein